MEIKKRIYWCDSCQVPLLDTECLKCGKKGKDLCAPSISPVFMQEIEYIKKYIDEDLHPILEFGQLWVSPSSYTYYCQGISVFKLSAKNTCVKISPKAKYLKPLNRTRKEFLEYLREANKDYIENIQYEAHNFIRNVVKTHDDKITLVSFSGGKDSTVISHLVTSAVNINIIHLFADTTIEKPDTYTYINDFQKQHPLTPFITCKSELDFFKISEDISPPSRVLRWCCSTHKTSPLSKTIDNISPNKKVLTFDGVRKYESSKRKNYPRISNESKVTREIMARPILEWTDSQVWFYILFHDIPFNLAYEKGFRRVGCLYCPFGSTWTQRMIKEVYPDQANKWNSFLKKQSIKIKHPKSDVFVEHSWRVRAGGQGHPDFYKTMIESAPCALSNTAITYQLLSGDINLISQFLRPLGRQVIIHSNYFIIFDYKTNKLVANVEIDHKDKTIRIDYLLTKYKRLFQQRVEKQLRKLQSCIFCGSCAAKCPVNAIEIRPEGIFSVDETKCISCLLCVKHKCIAVKSLHYRA